MNRQPTLEGERLRLRPLLESDWDALYDVARDPLLWEQHPNHDRWQKAVFRAYFEAGFASGGAVAIVERSSGEVIGSSRWDRFDPADGGYVEIGWTYLARAHWGTGLNREIKRLMVEHALRYVRRIVFRVGETNWRSRRAMEKIGGQLTNRTTIEPTASGSVRHVQYEITRESFPRGPLAA